MSELRMPAINQVAIAGRLVQDPELRQSENGVLRLVAHLAVNRSYRDRNNEWQEEASFFNIVLWHKQAEYCASRLHKGSPVLVTGRLRSYSWKGEDQQPHSLVEIQVRNLQLLEKTQERMAAEIEEHNEEEGELELV
ncbi:MAG: single-stranded DNA-binding protein [Candidatus Latescibacteria bacterium]|nr:single-stranded DNA-binding protein [Candidatus Latescibacterota bacterium]